MTSFKENRSFFKEPTHDEIAISAFLAWERDGRPQDSDVNYWLEAEARLRAQRQKLAEAAAAQAAKPWPPRPRTTRAKAVEAKQSPAAAAKPSLATNVGRATAMKVKPSGKASGTRRLSPLKATR